MTATGKESTSGQNEELPRHLLEGNSERQTAGRNALATRNPEMLLRNLPCAVYSAFYGRTGPMTFVSKEWEHWTGYSAEEISQNPDTWPKCIHPDDRQRALSNYEIACRDEVPYSLEYQIVHRHTGQVRYVRDQGLLSEDRETDILRVDGIVTDITELKEMENELAEYRDHLEDKVAERTARLSRANEVLRIEDAERQNALDALKASEEKFRMIFENVTDVICYVDTKARVLDVNRRIEEMLGYTPEEVKGEDFSSSGILCTSDIPRLLNLFKDAILTGKPVSPLELRLRHKNGNEVTVEVGTQFISEDKKVIGAVMIIKDVTEQRRAEQALLSLNKELRATIGKLTSANRDLVDFAHIAAHDLKAPLRGIGSIAGIVCAEYGDVLDDKGRELLQMLVGRASRMYTHIDGILRYSKIGRSVEKKQKINTRELVEEIVTSIAPPRNIRISVSKNLPTIESRKTLLVQVFQNLLDNAIKYMDKPQGHIKVDCTEEDRFWKFSIADNGCGIDEKYFDKIFKMFQTLNRRDEIESTGIGLSTVKKIVENLGGGIWVESRVGHGATFFFTLPQ
jgi:PAS domain S-box-containing protein